MMASVVTLWPNTAISGIKKPGSYQDGWDDAMSTLKFQLEVAEAKGAGRGRSEERAALRFHGSPPMPEGWQRQAIDLKTGG